MKWQKQHYSWYVQSICDFNVNYQKNINLQLISLKIANSPGICCNNWQLQTTQDHYWSWSSKIPILNEILMVLTNLKKKPVKINNSSKFLMSYSTDSSYARHNWPKQMLSYLCVSKVTEFKSVWKPYHRVTGHSVGLLELIVQDFLK